MTAAFWDFAKLRGVESLQNLHPLIVHYPIALLIASFPIYFLAWVLRSDPLEVVGMWLLGLGTLGVASAVYTGWSASESVMIAPSVRDHILMYHERLMFAVLGLSLLMSGWALFARPMPERGRPLFMIGLLLMILVLVKGADYGGWMVFGYNAGGSLPQPIEFSK